MSLPSTDIVFTQALRAIPKRLLLGRPSVSGRLLHGLIQCLAAGRLTIVTPSGDRIETAAQGPGPEATLNLHNWRLVRRLLADGQIGFAESYIDGDWTSPDLAALIELFALNQDALNRTLMGTRLARLLVRLQHRKHANTRRGSRRNIEAHYDLGNDFYAAWLDRGMSYSSAYYKPDAASGEIPSLEEAQRAKQDLVIDRLALAGGERVLEIGCGWGGLAERLILETGCHVTGLTLSPAQLEHARTRLEDAGLSGQHDLRLQDYRDVEGRYDRIVSIEMLEAVGAEYWQVYFTRLRQRLASSGRAVLQVITIAERYYESYRRDPDFIQRHIFPGGMLPSVNVLRAQIEEAGLTLRSMQHFGGSYAATLAEWQRRFQLAWPRLRGMGFDDGFKRKWEYYLAYCEAGFRAGSIDVGLYELTHPGGG
jgi:cyclopropane-fatty-acyl-phospholipid synthase